MAAASRACRSCQRRTGMGGYPPTRWAENRPAPAYRHFRWRCVHPFLDRLADRDFQLDPAFAPSLSAVRRTFSSDSASTQTPPSWLRNRGTGRRWRIKPVHKRLGAMMPGPVATPLLSIIVEISWMRVSMVKDTTPDFPVQCLSAVAPRRQKR